MEPAHFRKSWYPREMEKTMLGWTEDGGWMPDQWMEKRADEAEGKRMEDGWMDGCQALNLFKDKHSQL